MAALGVGASGSGGAGGEAELFHGGGGALLLLGVPAGASIGLDGAEWAVGDAFRGFRGVPPRGVHLLTSCAEERAGGAGATRVAEFIALPPGSVDVRRWREAEECLGPRARLHSADADEDERLGAGVKRGDFDASTAAYERARWAEWRALTHLVTPTTLERAGVPLGARLHPGDPDVAPGGATEGAIVARIEDGFRTPVFAGTALRARRPVGASSGEPVSGAALTRLATDGRARLDAALAECYANNGTAMLAEVQLAFVLFLFGSGAAALAQWQASVALLCSCARDAAASRPELYAEFAQVLGAQLQHVPEDFFEDPLAAGSAVEGALAELLATLEDDAWRECSRGADSGHAPGGRNGAPHRALSRAGAQLCELAFERFGPRVGSGSGVLRARVDQLRASERAAAKVRHLAHYSPCLIALARPRQRALLTTRELTLHACSCAHARAMAMVGGRCGRAGRNADGRARRWRSRWR